MKRSIPPVVLLAAVVAGCAATPEAPRHATASLSAPAPASASPGYHAMAPAVAGPPDAAPRGGPAVPDESGSGDRTLAIWRDPEFRRRFIESYIAETEIEPRVTVVERKEMQAILELVSDQKIAAAIERLRESLGAAASATFDFTLANLLFQQEDLAGAAAAYEEAVRKHPKFRRAWKNLGLVRIREGDFKKARPALTRVIELGGGDAITYGLLGFAYSAGGDDLAAESAYRMANLLDPATLDWRMGMARSFFKQRRYADAVALCGTLVAENPDRADLWLLQANAYIGLGEPHRAAENYELVDRMGRSTVDSLNMLADIYINDEIFDLAVDGYIRAMEMDPQSNPRRAMRAAKVLTIRGALAETRRLIRRIEDLYGEGLSTGERIDLLKLRARVAVAEGAGDEEIEVLEKIVDLDPLDGEALLLLGQHARRTGDPTTAIFYFERAANIEGFEADARVRKAQLLVGEGKYAEALPLLRRAQVLKPRENVQEYLEQVERAAQSRR